VKARLRVQLVADIVIRVSN